MKKNFEEYLHLVGITTVTLKKRVDELIKYASNLCNEPLEDIFISEYIKKDGDREYTNLRFYSKKYTITFRSFISENDFAIVDNQKPLESMTLKTKDYDLKNAKENSRIHLYVQTFFASYGNLRASKENCDVLMKIMRKYYISRLKPTPL